MIKKTNGPEKSSSSLRTGQTSYNYPVVSWQPFEYYRFGTFPKTQNCPDTLIKHREQCILFLTRADQKTFCIYFPCLSLKQCPLTVLFA